MQKITVVGKDSEAKKAVIVALRSNFKVLDLHQEQIEIKSTSSSSLVIYVSQEPYQQNVDRFNFDSHSVNLQTQIPKLNDVQRKLFFQLAKDLSDKENWEFLYLSRAKYFNIIGQLKILFDVDKKWQLVNLARQAGNPLGIDVGVGSSPKIAQF
jgi:hypothetical protein